MSNKSVKERVQAEFKDFAGEVEHLSAPELKQRIVGLQQGLAESETHREANEALAEARQVLNELVGPYVEVRKAVKLKTSYLLELLKDKGQ